MSRMQSFDHEYDENTPRWVRVNAAERSREKAARLASRAKRVREQRKMRRGANSWLGRAEA